MTAVETVEGTVTRPCDIPEGYLHRSDVRRRPGWSSVDVHARLAPVGKRTAGDPGLMADGYPASVWWYPLAEVERMEAEDDALRKAAAREALLVPRLASGYDSWECLSRYALRERGWRPFEITKYLGDPDAESGGYTGRNPTHLWAKERVTHAENAHADLAARITAKREAAEAATREAAQAAARESAERARAAAAEQARLAAIVGPLSYAGADNVRRVAQGYLPQAVWSKSDRGAWVVVARADALPEYYVGADVELRVHKRGGEPEAEELRVEKISTVEGVEMAVLVKRPRPKPSWVDHCDMGPHGDYVHYGRCYSCGLGGYVDEYGHCGC